MPGASHQIPCSLVLPQIATWRWSHAPSLSLSITQHKYLDTPSIVHNELNDILGGVGAAAAAPLFSTFVTEWSSKFVVYTVGISHAARTFVTKWSSSYIPYPREKPPMGGTPYIGFRPGGGPTFAVSLSHLSAEKAPRCSIIRDRLIDKR